MSGRAGELPRSGRSTTHWGRARLAGRSPAAARSSSAVRARLKGLKLPGDGARSGLAWQDHIVRLNRILSTPRAVLLLFLRAAWRFRPPRCLRPPLLCDSIKLSGLRFRFAFRSYNPGLRDLRIQHGNLFRTHSRRCRKFGTSVRSRAVRQCHLHAAFAMANKKRLPNAQGQERDSGCFRAATISE